MNIRISKKVIDSIKKIYPDLNGGFVYFETKEDGTHWENPIDGLFWDSQEYDKPDWQTIEDNFLDDIVYKKEELLALNKQKKAQARDKGIEITVGDRSYLVNEKTVLELAILKALGRKPAPWKDADNKTHLLTEEMQKNLGYVMLDIVISGERIALSVEKAIDSLTKKNIDKFDLDEAWKEAIKNVIK